MTDDRAAKKAEELLPEPTCPECKTGVLRPHCFLDLSTTECPRYSLARDLRRKRSAVAAELREAYAEIACLRTALQKAAGFKVDRCACVFIDDEPSLECGYHQTLRAELASIEQFAEAWPCHCAENYPGATIYHGQDCQTAVAVEFVAQWRAAKVKP